jgi:hypothetical protein
MKIFKEGEKSKAICPRCGMVKTTFLTRDVPIQGSKTIAKNILAGVCSVCDRVISIPQQSSLYVKEALHKEKKPLEIRIPKHLEDILANASLKIGGEYNSGVINFLIKYYIHRGFLDPKVRSNISKIYRESKLLDDTISNCRVSIKLDSKIFNEMKELRVNTDFKSDTELLKAIMLKINDDIVQNKDKKVVNALKDFAVAI